MTCNELFPFNTHAPSSFGATGMFYGFGICEAISDGHAS
jgi:hypothetical protein